MNGWNSDLFLDNQLFQQYMSMTNDLVSYIDSDLVYRAVNDAYLRAFGLKPSDIVGTSVVNLLGEEYFAEEVKNRMDECLAGMQVQYDSWFDFPLLGKRLYQRNLLSNQ